MHVTVQIYLNKCNAKEKMFKAMLSFFMNLNSSVVTVAWAQKTLILESATHMQKTIGSCVRLIWGLG